MNEGDVRGSGLNRAYMTRAGDTLEAIGAYFYGSPERRDALIERNPALGAVGANGTLNAGMILRVPDETEVTLSPEKRGKTEGEGADRTYTSDINDTLEKVAARFYGYEQRRDRIERENSMVMGLDERATLSPGLTLKVPADTPSV